MSVLCGRYSREGIKYMSDEDLLGYYYYVVMKNETRDGWEQDLDWCEEEILGRMRAGRNTNGRHN